MNVETPEGTDIQVPMNDDGLEADFAANDGIYSGRLQIETPGEYVVQPVLSGFVNSMGAEASTQFVRSTQHLVSVSDVRLDITGKANLARMDDMRMLVNIGVSEVNPKGTHPLSLLPRLSQLFK